MPYAMFDTLQNVDSWNSGFMARLLASGNLLRISERGLYYIEQQAVRNLRAAVLQRSWSSQACLPSFDALCEEQNNAKMQYFNQRKISVPENWPQTVALAAQSKNEYLLLFNDSCPCSRSGFDRFVSIGDTQYELSVCDLLDSKLDVIYDAAHMHVFWRRDQTEYLQYLLLGFVAIYLTSCIANNIVYVLQIDNIGERIAKKIAEQKKLLSRQECLEFLKANFEGKDADVMLHLNFDNNGAPSFVKLKLLRQNMILLPILLYLTWELSSNVDFLVLENDVTACVLLLVFMWVEYFAVNLKADVYMSYNVSLICSMLFLISMRIHYTLDNPYLVVLCVIFGIRSCFKFFAYCCYEHSRMRNAGFRILLIGLVLRVYDFYVFHFIVDFGITLSEPNLVAAELRKSIVYFVSFVLGAVLFLFHIKSKIEIEQIVAAKFPA